MYHAMHDPGFFTWPPSPQLAMVLIPYLRSTYFNIWRETLLPYEIKLNRQLLGLPPLEENNNNNNGGNGGNGNGGQNNNRDQQRNPEGLIGMLQGLLDVLDPDDEDFEGEGGGDGGGGELRIVQREGLGGIELELVLEELAEDEDEEGIPELEAPPHPAPEEQPQEQPAAEAVVALRDEDPAAPPPIALQPQPPAAPENHEAPPAPPARRPSLGSILLSISNAVVGALAMPVMSLAAGELLRLVLPRSWTTLPARLRRPTGLMQQQWGRSVVGGCMYVVVSDLMRVYAKHRKVAAMGTRKVKNVERRRR